MVGSRSAAYLSNCCNPTRRSCSRLATNPPAGIAWKGARSSCSGRGAASLPASLVVVWKLASFVIVVVEFCFVWFVSPETMNRHSRTVSALLTAVVSVAICLVAELTTGTVYMRSAAARRGTVLETGWWGSECGRTACWSPRRAA